MSAKPWWVDLAKAHVLVEDELTQALLSTTWSEVGVRVDHVGGEATVRGMVKAAHRPDTTTVFGVVDRDFSVAAGWAAGSPIFRLARHEAENYLLDFDALAVLASDSRATVEGAATAFARACCPWMAARRALHEINQGLTERFPQLPGPSQQTPLTVDAAVSLVREKTYWQGLGEKVKQHWSPAALQALVHQHHDTFDGEVTNGKWVETFSGKEVLQHLRGRFAKLAVPEVDLAIRVARRWRTTGVPTELTALLAEIKRRAAGA